jgi:hypothetical protein
MRDNEMFIWSGFLILLAAIVALWYISGKRKEYFSIMSQRELGVREQSKQIIYNSSLVIISLYVLYDALIMFLGIISAVINNGGSRDTYIGLESISADLLGITRLDVAVAYLGVLIAFLCFAAVALFNEMLLIQRMKDARRKLLLGELPEEEDGWNSVAAPSPTPIPPKSVTESNEPATFAAVLQAMDLQLKQAVQAAEDLKSELHETKEKVVTLEIEVQEKNSEITQIKESKSHFDKIIKESSESKDEGDEKSLSITDSVMIGDSIMGGVKIDKQINNDPEAIARAVIDAYRMGKSDSD